MNVSETADTTRVGIEGIVDTLLKAGLWIHEFVLGLAELLIANVALLSGPPEALIGLLLVMLFVGAL